MATDLREGGEEGGSLGAGCMAIGTSRVCMGGGPGLCLLCSLCSCMWYGCRPGYINIPLHRQTHLFSHNT